MRTDPDAMRRLAFELGWDHAVHGVDVPSDFSTNKDVIDGNHAARQKTTVGSPPDRYVRKWLQLRRNAWTRQMIVSENVTPAFLREIDHKCCPILGIELTHSTGEDTDWSVDRAINDLPYMRGNIVIMSVRANQRKGSYDLSQIAHFAQASSEVAGLTPQQWQRMHDLLHPAAELLSDHSMFLSPAGIPISAEDGMREWIAKLLADGGQAALDEERFPFFGRKEARRATRRLLGEVLRSLQRYSEPNQIWQRKKLRRLFDEWLRSLRRAELVTLAVALYNAHQRRGRIADDLAALEEG